MKHRKFLLLLLGSLLLILTAALSCAPRDSGNSALRSLPTIGSQVGNLATTFTLADLEGKAVSLADFKGKPVLINFWATWCPPCREEMSYLQRVYNEWSAKGLVMLAINVQESHSKITEFLMASSLTLPVLIDSTGGVSGSYGIMALPTTFFIDGEGVIRQRVIGGFPNQEMIVEELRNIMP